MPPFWEVFPDLARTLSQWEIWLGAGLFSTVFYWVHHVFFVGQQDAILNAEDRRALIDKLKSGSLGINYSRRIHAMLDAAERWLEGPRDNAMDSQRAYVSRAWSAGLLMIMLALAVAYPVISVIVQWLFSNQPVALGEVVIAEPAQAIWPKLLVVVSILIAPVGAWLLWRADEDGRAGENYLLVLGAFTLGGIPLGGLLSVFDHTPGVAALGPIIAFSILAIEVGRRLAVRDNDQSAALKIPAIAIGIALGIAAGAPVAAAVMAWFEQPSLTSDLSSFIGVIAMALAGGFTAVVLFLVFFETRVKHIEMPGESKEAAQLIVFLAFTISGGASVVWISAQPITGVLEIAIVAGVIFSGFFLILIIFDWGAYGLAQKILFLIILMATAVLGASLYVSDVLSADLRALILFIGVLPVVNAFFDFASVGATRFLLRIGAQATGVRTLALAALDLIVGGVIFVCLGAAAIAAIHVLRTSTGQALLDLPDFFTRLAANPGDFWWLYATFFSTLLPTVLHAFVASTAVFDGLIGAVAPRSMEALMQADASGVQGKARFAVNLLALGQAAGLVAAVLLAWTLLWALTLQGLNVASVVFDLLTVWAKMIGALPPGWVRP